MTTKMSRRNFLKVTGTATAGATVAATMPEKFLSWAESGESELKQVPTFCELCFWNCGLIAKVQNGKVTGGVKNLRSRLALHFGGAARLSIGPSGQGTLACIRFEATQVEFSHDSDEGPGC